MSRSTTKPHVKAATGTMFYQITHYPNQNLLYLHLGGDFEWQYYMRAVEECSTLFESIEKDTAFVISVADNFAFRSDNVMENADKLALQQPPNLTTMVVVGLPPQFQVAYQIFTRVYKQLQPQQIFSVDNLEDALALIYPLEETARIS